MVFSPLPSDPLVLVPLPMPPFQRIRLGGSPRKGKGGKQECVCSGSHGVGSKSHDSDNGFHSWNQKFSMKLGQHTRCVTIEVKCKSGVGVVRDVGVVRIAVSNLLGGLVIIACSLCYRLRN